MRTIQLTQDDYDFLKELQHELNTQENDGNANPVYWGVIETKQYAVPDDCGETYIVFDDGKWSLEEAVEQVEDYLASLSPEEKKIVNIYGEDSTLDEQWEAVDHDNITDVYDFMCLECKWQGLELYDFTERYELSTQTGAFLTKRACKEYIKKYGYNHSKPQTYAMTAYRNFELGRLLKILREMKLGDE